MVGGNFVARSAYFYIVQARVKDEFFISNPPQYTLGPVVRTLVSANPGFLFLFIKSTLSDNFLSSF